MILGSKPGVRRVTGFFIGIGIFCTVLMLFTQKDPELSVILILGAFLAFVLSSIGSIALWKYETNRGLKAAAIGNLGICLCAEVAIILPKGEDSSSTLFALAAIGIVTMFIVILVGSGILRVRGH